MGGNIPSHIFYFRYKPNIDLIRFNVDWLSIANGVSFLFRALIVSPTRSFDNMFLISSADGRVFSKSWTFVFNAVTPLINDSFK